MHITHLLSYRPLQSLRSRDAEEFRHVLKKHEIKVWLAAMDLDVSNVEELFNMLNTAGAAGSLLPDLRVMGLVTPPTCNSG